MNNPHQNGWNLWNKTRVQKTMGTIFDWNAGYLNIYFQSNITEINSTLMRNVFIQAHATLVEHFCILGIVMEQRMMRAEFKMQIWDINKFSMMFPCCRFLLYKLLPVKYRIQPIANSFLTAYFRLNLTPQTNSEFPYRALDLL